MKWISLIILLSVISIALVMIIIHLRMKRLKKIRTAYDYATMGMLQQLNHLAYHDPLTNLDNRAQLEKNIENAIFNSNAQKTKFALIILDLDRFKNINDSLGHDAGDTILKIVAERLKISVRHTDSICRLGGDEFVILITDIMHSEVIANIAQKLLDNVLKRFLIKGHQIYITTSIGISIYPDDGENIHSLLENADVALYRAKDLGRNNYQFCTYELSAKSKDRLAKEMALRQALINNELRLFYQPKLDLNIQKIAGFEALLRWKSKKYGDIQPQEILPLAEKTGMMNTLNEWIFRKVCKQLKHWHEKHHSKLNVAINLSAGEFLHPNIVTNISQLLSEMKINPEQVELEIAEGLIMTNPENNIHTIHALKNIGLKIAIDDFGSGYSSLNYLQHYSVDRIKINLGFVREITNDANSAAIVKAMIAMAHQLEIKVVAVGVETQEQYEFLCTHGCDEIQGYLLSPALSLLGTTRFLKSSHDMNFDFIKSN